VGQELNFEILLRWTSDFKGTMNHCQKENAV
jgi:hypothetical protein